MISALFEVVQNKFDYEDVFYALRQVQLVFAPPWDEMSETNPHCQRSHFSQANLQLQIKSVPKFNLTNVSTPCMLTMLDVMHNNHHEWETI